MSPRKLHAAAVVASLAALLAPAAAQAAFPGRNGELAVGFGFGCDGSAIATMQPDGTGFRRLTPDPCVEDEAPYLRAPDWFADGSRMALLWATTPATMRADGSELTRLEVATPPYFTGEKPSVSPDGRKLLFTRVRATPRGGVRSIWRSNLDGSDAHRIRDGRAARWSPNGRTIAYVAPGTRGTWLMSARTGRNLRRITRRAAASLDWAPDGRRIVYAANRGTGGNVDLYVARADGTGSRRLTSTALRRELEPVWSPNGRRIAYVRVKPIGEVREQLSIFTIGRRGGDHRRIYQSPVLQTEELLDRPTLSWRPLPR